LLVACCGGELKEKTVFIVSHDTETELKNNRHKMIERRGN
jgi:hypothetical protein